MPRKPEPKFTVIYSDKPLDLPEEELKRRYDSFIKFLVEAYKESVAREAEEEAKSKSRPRL